MAITPPTPAETSPQPTNNRPWTISAFLIDQFDSEFNNDRYMTGFFDPCNITRHDLGLPYGLFAERFFKSTHSPQCQSCQQPPPKQNIGWRPLQFVVLLVFSSSSSISNNNNDHDDDATNCWIPRQDLHRAIENWRSDEVAAMKTWASDRATFQHYWSSSRVSSSSSTNNNNKEEEQQHEIQKTFTAQVKDATDQKARRGWIIELLKRFTTIPSFVWYVISFTELMWSWRYFFYPSTAAGASSVHCILRVHWAAVATGVESESCL
jgi:hypothetical protein